jgi:hypothetical protein
VTRDRRAFDSKRNEAPQRDASMNLRLLKPRLPLADQALPVEALDQEALNALLNAPTAALQSSSMPLKDFDATSFARRSAFCVRK